MSTKWKFAGTVVRTEPGGFGVIHFDKPVGPSGNTHGIISSSTGTSTVTFTNLKPGVRINGFADADSHQLATIRTFTIDTNK